jgi:hypothetical protein
MRIKMFINNVFGKKTTDIETFANGLFIDFYNKELFDSVKKLFDDFINEIYGYDIDEDKFGKIYNEWILLRLALSYGLSLSHYNDHINIKEIDNVFRKRISSILLSLYGEKYINIAENMFTQRVKQYKICLSDKKNPIKAIATLFKFIIETIIHNNDIPESMVSFSTAQKFTLPSAYHSAQYLILISGVITTHQKVINKWSIAKTKNA